MIPANQHVLFSLTNGQFILVNYVSVLWFISQRNNLCMSRESEQILLFIPLQWLREISGRNPERVICQSQAVVSAGARGEDQCSEETGRNTYRAEEWVMLACFIFVHKHKIKHCGTQFKKAHHSSRDWLFLHNQSVNYLSSLTLCNVSIYCLNIHLKNKKVLFLLDFVWHIFVQISSQACRVRCEWCSGLRWRLSNSWKKSHTGWMPY